MQNLFRIDFIDGKDDSSTYNQIMHSIIDTEFDRYILSFSESADKLTSVSNYSREPKRITFECFVDSWIETYVLSGDYEHERYLSQWEVKIYRDSVLLFTGIIDTSLLQYDQATLIIKFTCYDKIRLFSIYSDLKHLYSMATGYYPQWILGYFTQDITNKIPIDIDYSNALTVPSHQTTDLELGSVPYSDMDSLLPDGNGFHYIYHSLSYGTPYAGFKVDTFTNVVYFVFAYKVVVQANYNNVPTYWSAKYRIRIYKFFNKICPVVFEYDKVTEWKTDANMLMVDSQNYQNYFAENGMAYLDIYSLLSTATVGSDVYNYANVSSVITAKFTGDIFPSLLFPGKMYETYIAESTENMKTLQMMLLLYNATIYCNNYGTIILKSKDSTATTTTINIQDADVLAFAIKRGNQEKPDLSPLEVLAGDTSILKSQLSTYLPNCYESAWEIETTIDNISKYDIQLFYRLEVKGKSIRVTEVQKDYQNDEYKIKGWQI